MYGRLYGGGVYEVRAWRDIWRRGMEEGHGDWRWSME